MQDLRRIPRVQQLHSGIRLGQARLPQPPPKAGESRRGRQLQRQILIAVDGSPPAKPVTKNTCKRSILHPGLTETREHLLYMVRQEGYQIVFLSDIITSRAHSRMPTGG